MWKCKECNAESDDNIQICRICGTEKNDSLNLKDKSMINIENDMAQANSKILFENNSAIVENNYNDTNKKKSATPNLFQGREEAEEGNANFPDWDIVPPDQFINPRVKPQ